MSFDYTTSVKAQRTKVCDSAWFHTVAQSTKVIETNYRIAQAHERKRKGEISESEFNKIKTEQKKQLPVFLFHAHFSDSKRWNASAVPSGLSIFDIDHIPDPEGEWKSISPRARQLGIVLAHLTPSCEGLRLVFIIPEEIRQAAKHPGEELAQGQKWLAGQLGITDYDECVKDYARCSFAVPEGYIFYIDEERLFTNYPPPSPPEREGGLITPVAEQPTLTHKSNHSPLRTEGSGEVLGEVLSPENLRIFSEMLEVSHLTVADLNADGSRHNNLLLLLSKGAARLMPKSQFLACMKHAAPDFYEERDCQDLIDDFYTKYADPNRPMSKALQKVYQDSLKRKGNEQVAIIEESSNKFELNIEAMPRAMRDTLVTTPEHLRFPVLVSILPCAATYVKNVNFRNIDNTLVEPTLSTFVIGPQASGKGAVTRMMNVWSAPMLEHDKVIREALAEWREKKENRAANEELPPMPKGGMQYLMATISNRELLDQMIAVAPGYVFIYSPEADTVIFSNKSGAWANNSNVKRLAHDNDLWGMSYKNSTTKIVNVRMNMTTMGTLRAFRRMFTDDNIENGLATRTIITEVPAERFARLVPYKTITNEMVKNINAGITTLSSAHGTLEMPRMFEMVNNWADEKLRMAATTDDDILDLFRKRTALIMFRCGSLFYMLEGKETDRIIKLTRQVGDYILYEQCKWFGTPLDEMNKETTVKLYRPQTAGKFEKLKSTFNMEAMQKAFPNKSKHALYNMTCYWVRNGYVVKNSDGSWTKK